MRLRNLKAQHAQQDSDIIMWHCLYADLRTWSASDFTQRGEKGDASLLSKGFCAKMERKHHTPISKDTEGARMAQRVLRRVLDPPEREKEGRRGGGRSTAR